MELPETVEVASSASPEGSVIWLHGLGADGHDFEPIVPQLGLAGQLGLRFVFPHAPMRPMTINSGMTMREIMLSTPCTAPVGSPRELVSLGSV